MPLHLLDHPLAAHCLAALRDRQTGQTLGSSTERYPATPKLSPDGRYLTFTRNSDNPSRATVVVYDRLTNQLTNLALGFRSAAAWRCRSFRSRPRKPDYLGV